MDTYSLQLFMGEVGQKDEIWIDVHVYMHDD